MTLANACRAILMRTVYEAISKLFVSIRIVNRGNDKCCCIEDASWIRLQQVSHQHQDCFFTLDFTGVDICLDVHDEVVTTGMRL